MSQNEPNPQESSQEKSSESQPSVTQTQNSTATKIDWKAIAVGTMRSTRETIERVIATIKAESQSGDTLTKVKNVLIVLWQAFLPVWQKLIELVRTRLPQELNQKLNDRLLSGIVASVLVISFWFTSSLFSAKPVKPTIAQRPVIDSPTQPNPAFPSDLTTSEPEVVSGEPAPEIGASPESETPIAVAPEPSPEPEIELTPEQKLIASVEQEVYAVSDQFIGGLVLSVQPNFERGRLVVKLSPDWFRFNPEQQDRFANDLWQRSQPLNFTRLEIRDPNGELLARNPIVGTAMVILKRKQLPATA